MDCQVKLGKVVAIIYDSATKQELTVLIGSETATAINFPELIGPCLVDDIVSINTTAVSLGLGTGGTHFVMAINGREQPTFNTKGHIMKVRYTPSQGRVLSVEEPDSPYHHTMQRVDSIAGLPVIVGSLHSMLAPVCLGFNAVAANKKLVYLMSDGAALPLALSRQVTALKEHNLITATITFNHAFGGDYEAVNVYSALLAAKYVCQADAAVILMGPGVVGTNTRWGNTAVEQGIFLNAVHTLVGQPIAILRTSFADQRNRHYGISHHSLTALEKIVTSPVIIPLPLDLEHNSLIKEQLTLLAKHQIQWIDTKPYRALLEHSQVKLKTMGRGFSEDSYFFESALAAGLTAGLMPVVNPQV